MYTSSFTLNIAPALDITDSRVVYVIKGYKFIYGENIVVTGGRKPFRYVLSARVSSADSALCSTIRTRMRRLPLPCPRGSCDTCALSLRWRVGPFSGHVNVLGGLCSKDHALIFFPTRVRHHISTGTFTKGFFRPGCA